MTNTLKFLRTFTLDEFKEWKGILQIRIIRNEQTGKYFFGYGDKAGDITSKYPAEPLDHPVVSEVILRGERRAVSPAPQCRGQPAVHHGCHAVTLSLSPPKGCSSNSGGAAF